MRILKTSLKISALLLVPMAAGSQQSSPNDNETFALKELDCIVEPSEVVELGSSVPGVIDEVFFERNNFVNAGDIVAKLDSRVEMATHELATARAELNTSLTLRKENAAFGLRTQKRNKELFKESTISEQDMDKVETETQIATLQARQEEDNIHIAQLEAERALQALNQRTMRSPINGVVMERYKSVGEYIDAEPVFRIANLDPLMVELIVPVEHFGTIESGAKAEVTIDLNSNENETHVAVVTSVDRVADAASGTFGVLLTMPNAGLRIPSGVRCSLDFLTQ